MQCRWDKHFLIREHHQNNVKVCSKLLLCDLLHTTSWDYDTHGRLSLTVLDRDKLLHSSLLTEYYQRIMSVSQRGNQTPKTFLMTCTLGSSDVCVKRQWKVTEEACFVYGLEEHCSIQILMKMFLKMSNDKILFFFLWKNSLKIKILKSDLLYQYQ